MIQAPVFQQASNGGFHNIKQPRTLLCRSATPPNLFVWFVPQDASDSFNYHKTIKIALTKNTTQGKMVTMDQDFTLWILSH